MLLSNPKCVHSNNCLINPLIMINLFIRHIGRTMITSLSKIVFFFNNKHVDLGYGTRILHGSKLEGYNKIHDYSVFGGHLGKYSYIGSHSHVTAIVGRFCSIGPNVRTITSLHPTNFVSTHPSFYSTHKQSGITFSEENLFAEQVTCESIKIGNDVFIGDSVVILPGVQIGDGAIIGAGAVVTKDVESYSIVAGNPAKLIRKRFSEKDIEFLLESKWWLKDEIELRRVAKSMSNIDNFKCYNNENMYVGD